MIKKAIFKFFLCFLLLLHFSNLFADQRIENIEIYLILDKSLSMVEEIESVKEYIVDNIITNLVLPGDYFLLIPFYGKTDSGYNGFINSEKDKTSLRNNIINIKADGRFTDIGNALEDLRKNIKSNTESTRKYMLLITDGKQEAPPESRFYSSDGSFNHAFLENTKEIKKEGWKIIVLGIGTETAAKEIAKELSAGYSSLSRNISSEEISKTIDTFLGRFDLVSLENELLFDKKGNGNIVLDIKSTGFTELKEIKIIEIRLNNDLYQNLNILNNPFVFKLRQDEVTKISIPVELPSFSEKISGEITFVFEGKNAFAPSIHKVSIELSKDFSFFYYIAIIAVVIIILIYYGVIIIQRKRIEDDKEPNEL